MSTAAPLATVPVTDAADPYNALLDRIHEEMKPNTEHECFLVDQITHARWKLELIREAEADLLEQTLAGKPVEAKLAFLMRCSAAAERSYYKAQREFTESRRLNKQEDLAAFKQTIDEFLKPPPGHARASVTPIAEPTPRPELASFRKIENAPARR